MNDFDYLKEGDVYLDSACQSLRPRPVIEALNRYYTEHNSCGERVKYAWGRKTDELVEATREKVLKYLKLKGREYSVSFTLNTTYGINLLLSQIRKGLFDKVMTSDIEHNSPFLATMACAKRLNVPREVMEREEDGSIDLDNYDFSKAIVVVNCASNIDGRRLLNNNGCRSKNRRFLPMGSLVFIRMDIHQGSVQIKNIVLIFHTAAPLYLNLCPLAGFKPPIG